MHPLEQLPANRDLEVRVHNLEEQVRYLHQRNRRVEADKAWETSWTRFGIVTCMTYSITALVFFLIKVDQVLLNAFIPTCAYIVSTLSLPLVKNSWLSAQDVIRPTSLE